jgi:hypothetical protein
MEDGSHELARVGLRHLGWWTRSGYGQIKVMSDDLCLMLCDVDVVEMSCGGKRQVL